MSAKVCVAGSFMMDLVASAPRRPERGETVIGTEFTTYVGGKGFNQAVAAARAGADTTFVGRLGDDEFGASFRKAMRAEGIDDSGVVTDESVGTGVGLPVLEPDGHNSIVVVPRANWAVDPTQIRQYAEAIESADVLLLQLELPLPAVAEATRIAHRSGTLVVLNPAPYFPITELLGLVDLLVPNEVELRALGRAYGLSDAAMLASSIGSRWGADLVATLGGDGAFVQTASGTTHRIPPCRVEPIDTIGAGDVFCGYLAVSVASGLSVVDAARVANAAAALAITRQGAAESAPREQEVLEFIADTKGDRVPQVPDKTTELSKEATSW